MHATFKRSRSVGFLQRLSLQLQNPAAQLRLEQRLGHSVTWYQNGSKIVQALDGLHSSP